MKQIQPKVKIVRATDGIKVFMIINPDENSKEII
jgi:hypothetical protein